MSLGADAEGMGVGRGGEWRGDVRGEVLGTGT